MNGVFEHIAQARGLLYQIFECGLAGGRGVEDALAGCGDCAVELGLAHGASLLRALAGELTALRAGQGSPGGATLCCANLVSYYDMLSAMAVIENISARAEK